MIERKEKMARILGVELKAIKGYRGHDGESLSEANIYIDGKKVGIYWQDTHGGPNQVEVSKADSEILKKRAELYISKYPNGVRTGFIATNIDEKEFEYFNVLEPIDAETLILELLELSYIEKDFKKIMKKSEKRNAMIITYKNIFEYQMCGLTLTKPISDADMEKVIIANKLDGYWKVFKKEDFEIDF